MAPLPLEALFLPHLPPGLPPLPAGAWEEALVEALARVRRRYPSLPPDPGRWLPLWARALATEAPTLEGLASLHVEDMALACAVVEGQPAAVALFERECLAWMLPSLRRQGVSPDREGEALQGVRRHLLVPPAGGEVRLLRYQGKGELRRWVHVAGLRALRPELDRWRQERHLVGGDDALEGLAAATTHAELGLISAHHQQAFKQAFQRALSRLDARGRNLLRYQILSGLNIDQIGAIYQVHRATVARWLAAAREQLLEETRAALRESLRVDNDELDSLLRGVQSQVDVSLRRLLAPGASTLDLALSRRGKEEEG